MKPHRRQYEVHGQSVNLEKFRIHILEVINDNELTIPQIANALKTETRKLQGVLYNMHAEKLLDINKEGRFHVFSKVKVSMLQEIYHPMPDFSDRIKSIYINSSEEQMHIDRLKQILDDWALWMHSPSHKLGYPSKSLGMISGGESTSEAFEDMVSAMDMTNVRTIDVIISNLPRDQKDAVYARYLKTVKYDDYEYQLGLAFDNLLSIAARRIVA